ncbi:MAG: radical SAM protein [Oscillospiraceae bacterium]
MPQGNKYRDTKNLCTKSSLPASDYVINPYVGCTHRCRYCYASFMGRFTGHKEPWGTYLEPRRYLSMRLPKGLEGKTILIGSVTDAYNPAERHYRLMPQILQALRDCPAHVEILTKSPLVLRDIEWIRQVPDIAVGLSLSNLCQADNAVLEPGAGSAQERLAALRTLHDSGIRTYLFIAPYLPGLTQLRPLAAAVRGSVDCICVENLNLRGSCRTDMLALIDRLHPELSPLYRDIYLGGGAGKYWESVEAEISALRASADVPVISYMYHEKIKKGARKI